MGLRKGEIMKTKINYMVQWEGLNFVEVIYKSGIRRVVGLGDRYYTFTKTQNDFIDNATIKKTEFATFWMM